LTAWIGLGVGMSIDFDNFRDVVSNNRKAFLVRKTSQNVKNHHKSSKLMRFHACFRFFI